MILMIIPLDCKSNIFCQQSIYIVIKLYYNNSHTLTHILLRHKGQNICTWSCVINKCIGLLRSCICQQLKTCSYSFVFLTLQFVPMREFMGRAGENPATIQAILAKEVLEEIPDQFLSYMKSRNIKPKPPLQRQLTISSVTSLPVTEQ